MLPPRHRARLGLERKDLLDFAEPQNWPELKQVADAIGLGDRVFAAPSRDRGVLRVVELLADFDVEPLLAACERVRASDWWRTGKRKGLSSLSPEVVNRALADDGAVRPDAADPTQARIDALFEDARKARQAAEGGSA